MGHPELKRKFGDTPEWASKGPVDVYNYEYRAERHGKLRQWGDRWPFLSRNPDLPSTGNEGEWDLYFRDHLGGFPSGYNLYRNGVITYYNVPEVLPEEFDVSWRGPRVTQNHGA